MPVRFEEELPKGSKVRFEVEAPPKGPETPMLQSAGLGAMQGASFGLADEIEGGFKSVKDVLSDKYRIADLLDRYRANRDSSRADYEKARQDNPASYTAGEVGGGIATAFIPGLGWANAARGAGIAAKLGTAAAAGAVTGFGQSTADVTKGDIENSIEDTVGGAILGAGTQGVLSGAGKIIKSITPTNIAKKAANVFLNTPEEVTDTYIKNSEGVLKAPRNYELATAYQDTLGNLKKEVIEGSQKSRQILTEEGKTVGAGRIADILDQKAEKLAAESEGVWDNPQKLAAYKWLKQTAEEYKRGGITQGPDALSDLSPDQLQRQLSTNRVKSTLQGIDNSTDFETGPGKFSRIDDQVKKDVRGDIDQVLKSESPAYAKQMAEQVAPDTELLREASEVAGTPGALANAFKRVERDQNGSGYFPREVIGRVDERMGTNFLEQAKLSNAREAFDKSITNGSRNVNFFSNMLKDVPVVKHLGPIVGGTVDKYGRKMTMGVVDTAVKLNKLSQSGAMQDFRAQAMPILELARQGNPAAILTFQMLSESNPEALKYLQSPEGAE